MNRLLSIFLVVFSAFALTGCDESNVIVTGVDEREANIIIVFLESRGIPAYKQAAASGGAMGGEGPSTPKFNIAVDQSNSIEAMSVLNSNGLPHRQGTNLLELFAKQGLMSTDKEETIRYQAGLASQITNMILLIDGVIDATVQISFPENTEDGIESNKQTKVTAAVFVKHQGIVDDPNSHLVTKIKRLVSGSVNGLSIDDVTVVSDRSRYTDVTPDAVFPKGVGKPNDYVKIWSITMDRSSAGTFRFIFFLLLIICIAFAASLGWLVWKVYPMLKTRGGLGELLNPIPLFKKKKESEEDSASNGDEEGIKPSEGDHSNPPGGV